MNHPALVVDHVLGDSIRCAHGDTELFRYVYVPRNAQLESPRPYFFPIRSLAGNEVAVLRPHDHIWHKGLAWSLPNVGPQNFWGGVTYFRDRGYAQEDNNGSIVHRDFAALNATTSSLLVDETLDWITSKGDHWFEELRAFSVGVDGAAGTWTLAYQARMTNVSEAPIPIGSPTTEGRPNAGYGGLFWRGPRSFTGGQVYAEGVEGGDDLMGTRGTWMALTGRHDEVDAASTVIFADNRPDAAQRPDQWFVRSTPFACIAPAPFFSEVVTVEPGRSLDFRYAVTVAVEDTGLDRAKQLAEGSAAASRALADALDPDRWS